MKAVLKGGSTEKNDQIKKFFMENIFPILEFGIAIEPSDSKITVYKKDGETVKEYIDPTVEVIVELTEKARNFARDSSVSDDELKQKSGEFFDEAQAIKKIEELQPDFSVEYYSCRYTPPSSKT